MGGKVPVSYLIVSTCFYRTVPYGKWVYYVLNMRLGNGLNSMCHGKWFDEWIPYLYGKWVECVDGKWVKCVDGK